MQNLPSARCILWLAFGLTPLSGAQQASNSDSAAASSAPVFIGSPSVGNGSYLALGNIVGTPIDVGTPTGDEGCLGVEAAYGYYYVSGRAGLVPQVSPSLIYQFDTSGALLMSYPARNNPSSLWGHRDLESDSTSLTPLQGVEEGRLWGGEENGHWVRYAISAGGFLDAGTVLPVVPGIGTIRALARLPGGSPGTERFVSADFTGPIIEFDETGSLLGTFSNPGQTFYGFALDPTNSNKLWASSQALPLQTCLVGPATMVRVIEMNRSAAYALTGAEFCGVDPPGGIAGGLDIYDGTPAGINPGFHTFIVVHQATSDWVVNYDSGISASGLASFCTPKTGLTCGLPTIGAVGTSSATSASGFRVEAQPARSCRAGLLLYSQASMAGTPFQGGTLCIQMATGAGGRAGPTNSMGTLGPNCDGAFSIDMNAFAQAAWVVPDCAGNPSGTAGRTPLSFLSNPGGAVFAQYVGRDSLTTGAFVSAGLSWVIGP